MSKTDDYGVFFNYQYKVIKKHFDWYLLYGQMQVGEAMRPELRIVKMSRVTSLYPNITLENAIKRFDELVGINYT